MTLYTKKGDDGKTTIFGCDQRISKSSTITEALGVLDEANSYLGICKLQAEKNNFLLNQKEIKNLIHQVQNDLFVIQAEVAGAEQEISIDKIDWLEDIVDQIESQLPEIKTFFISGGTLLASNFDFSRTLIRRAERRVVAVQEEQIQNISKETLIYLNRLSSLFYVLARFANQQKKITEVSPKYSD